MYFHKFPYSPNFEFSDVFAADGGFQLSERPHLLAIRSSAEGIFHFQVRGREDWAANESQSALLFTEGATEIRAVAGADGRLRIEDAHGDALLTSQPGRFFGQCGTSSIFQFVKEPSDQFYGLGEKWTGFEHSGKTTKFWNTDVWADFDPASYIKDEPPPDPVYVSIPYLIIRRGDLFIGLLLDNPHATFISTGFPTSIAPDLELAANPSTKIAEDAIQLGAEEGQPNLYVLIGPTLPELTRKLQRLVGPTPLPPAWALGYHQCRWGYRSEQDLLELDAKFREHGIPVDGLWLDIDYMRGYRVFTFDRKHFPDPARAMRRLAKAGRKVVPILDPGVKREPGFDVYERGRAAGAYCLNAQGGEFVGLVWPGQTVFPDFSLLAARDWWRQEVADLARLGIHGAWLDMNDPSTGPVDNSQMRFDRGRKSHGTYHNQYALGMASASRDGFLEAHPGERPFLLSRSGFTGSSRYTAIWTGDNSSNYFHLRNSIGTTLNLALSGVPFNGPDMGGFAGDTHPQLIMDWFKAGFLFPFFRNHSSHGTRRQEPWAFGPRVLKVLRRFIQLRYRLRPYLYNLFIEQERTGEAILRPLFYDFEDTRRTKLGLVDDQFLVGPWILQAPFLEEKQSTRRVVLPGKGAWYNLASGRWEQGDRKVEVKAVTGHTPIYVRNGAILPLARLDPADHAFHPQRVDFHVFLAGDGTAETTYRFDDGATFAYRDGSYSEVTVTAQRDGDALHVRLDQRHGGCGAADFTVSAPPEIQRVTINGEAAVPIAEQGVSFGSAPFPAYALPAGGESVVMLRRRRS